MREAGIRAAQVRRDVGVLRGEAFDVALVDHRLVPWDLEATIVAPIEVRVRNDRAKRVRRAVFGRHRAEPFTVGVAEQRRAPFQAFTERARVWVDEQLVRITAQATRRIPRSVNAVAVA